MAVKALPSAAYLRECFTYDPESGELRWRESRPREHFKTEQAWRRVTATYGGKIAGSLHESGYIHVKLNLKLYKAHRLIWRMQTGRQPPKEIDHRNTDKADNRWKNLRKATREQNQWNRPRREKRVLPRGVYTMPSGLYRAQVNYFRKVIHLGTFDTPEEARAAYRSFTDRFRGEFQHPD